MKTDVSATNEFLQSENKYLSDARNKYSVRSLENEIHTFKLQLITIELGCRANLSTSSIPTTSILLYTYTHFMYLRLPSITSIRSSTVASSRNKTFRKLM